jgi:hypothetical protein
MSETIASAGSPRLAPTTAVDAVEVADSEKSVSDISTKRTLKESCIGDFGSQTLMPASDWVTLIRHGGGYRPAKPGRLRNSLLAAVGLLELANSGDFAANVWNEIPVPPYAVALMAVGGAVALSLSYFAFKDAKLSWQNIRLLREERYYLQTQKSRHAEDRHTVRNLDACLDVDFREVGTELIDRVAMDLLMGFGAILVGIGTFMAIDGANRRVWHASNLLSGYIGNTPAALYGTVNAAWSTYVWTRAHRHCVAGAKELNAGLVEGLLNRRVRAVKTHALINGTTGVFAGVASLITATRWWGYVILIPCIVSSIYCNYFWRRRIGYERPFVRQMLRMDKISLTRELEFVSSVQQLLKEAPSESLQRLASDYKSIASVIEFIVMNDLFEDFCIRLLHDTHLSAALFGISHEDLTIDSRRLLAVDVEYIPRILEIAQTCVSEMGPTYFQYRERYLLETLGCYLSTPEVGPSKTTLDCS